MKRWESLYIFGMYFIKFLVTANIKPNQLFSLRSIYLFCPTNLFYIYINKSNPQLISYINICIFLNPKSIWVSFTGEFDKGKRKRTCLHLFSHNRSPLIWSLNSVVRKDSCRCLVIDAWVMNPTVFHIFEIWSKIRIEIHVMIKKYFTEVKEKRTEWLCKKLFPFYMEGKGILSLCTKSFRTFCSQADIITSFWRKKHSLKPIPNTYSS